MSKPITITARIQVGENGLPVAIRSSKTYAVYADREGKLSGKRIGEERMCEITIYPKEVCVSSCNMPAWA